MNGFLVIDKPGGCTSRDVVNIAQKWFPRGTKIGHTGTLDPLATGVLVLCVGSATKLADKVQALGKTYETRIWLGAESDSDDIDADVRMTNLAPLPREEIEAKLLTMVGDIQQLPPKVSALKVGGRRAHDLARRGAEFDLQPRTVRIDRIDVRGYEWPHLDLTIACGKGTYIRSIARDLGGVVQTLRRTAVGPFTVDTALTLPTDAETARSKLISSSNPSFIMLSLS